MSECQLGFSVVIPLYNKVKYIRRAVESVLNQNLQNIQLIVVNDGSTDNSVQVISDIKDQRLEIINQENQGVGSARNTGAKRARFDWVALLDADDMWFPDHLEELRRITECHPEAGLISTGFLEVLEGTSVSNTQKKPSKIELIDYFLRASEKIGIINSSTAAVKRVLFDILGGFKDFKAGEDLEFWARLALDYPVAISDHITSVYFRNTNGTMAQRSAQRKYKKSAANANVKIYLSDVSPSVALLCKTLDNPKYSAKLPSIRLYINSRIYNGIRIALYQGDIKRAKNLSGVFIEPAYQNTLILKILMKIPDIVLLWVLKIYKLFKDVFM